MSITVGPTESDTLAALRGFLLQVLPAGIPIVQGQQNRVPEPKASDFVVMTPIRRERLSTNLDTFVDAKFQGSIAGTLMTISAVDAGYTGQIKVGSTIFGVNVQPNTVVTALGTGTGGVGTYTVSLSQTVASEVLAAGVLNITQATDVTIQLDVHGPSSANNVQIISTTFRDDIAVTAIKAINPSIAPLHADNPTQRPFLNDQQQYEWRWGVDACLQVNAVVLDIPTQFFDQIDVTFDPADITEPA